MNRFVFDRSSCLWAQRVVVTWLAIAVPAGAELLDHHPEVVGVTTPEAKLRVALVIGELAYVARQLDDLSQPLARARQQSRPYELKSLQEFHFRLENKYVELRERLEGELKRYGHMLEGFVFDWDWFEGQRATIGAAYFELSQVNVDAFRPQHEALLVARVFGEQRPIRKRSPANQVEQHAPAVVPPESDESEPSVWTEHILPLAGLFLFWLLMRPYERN